MKASHRSFPLLPARSLRYKAPAMGARSTIRTTINSETGETLELKEGVVLDRAGRQLTPERTASRPFGARSRYMHVRDDHTERFSLSGGSGLWVLMLAFFTPVLAIASFLVFGSLAAVLGIAFFAFAVLRAITRIFS